MVATINAVEAAKMPGMVALRDLCEELKINPAAARTRLRQANMKTTGGAYCWAKDSDDIQRVRDLLRELASSLDAPASSATFSPSLRGSGEL
jgi:hypothetical protein